MISHLRVTNFKRFDRYHVRLTNGNILVGPNNSGKSSILDCFKILDFALRYAKGASPKLKSIEGKGVVSYFELPVRIVEFLNENLSNNYSVDDSILEFTHNNKNKIVITFSETRAPVMHMETSARLPRKSSEFRSLFPGDLVIIPPISPLEENEIYLKDETVKANARTRLASRSFRNFWLRQSEEDFQKFRADVEKAWPNIVMQPPNQPTITNKFVTMHFEERRIPREIYCSGFGFQIWLQLMTHLQSCTLNSTLILDEPDVYLHPDLQRSLYRLIKERCGQFIIATHAIEIINEADTDEIVTVNSSYKAARRINSEDEFLALHRYLGSHENAEFARIAKSRRIIFVEGKDGRLLRKFANILGLVMLHETNNVPIMKLGGFSEWRKAQAAVWAFQEIIKIEMDAFCIFDRDFKSDVEVRDFLAEFDAPHLRVRVLARKEIENYLLIPEAIAAAANLRLRERTLPASVSATMIRDILRQIASELETDIGSQLSSQEIRHRSRRKSRYDESTVIKSSMELARKMTKDEDLLLRLLPGKEALSRLFERLKSDMGVSLTESMILSQVRIEQIAPDLVEILSAIDVFCNLTEGRE